MINIGEICVGVVKVLGIFEKGFLQYMVDLKMFEKEYIVQLIFVNRNIGFMKEVECVRVDGSYDEGFFYLEVQYWWILR